MNQEDKTPMEEQSLAYILFDKIAGAFFGVDTKEYEDAIQGYKAAENKLIAEKERAAAESIMDWMYNDTEISFEQFLNTNYPKQ